MKQIFKMAVPAALLFAFLDHVCAQSERHYVFDMNAFRKIGFHEALRDAFLRDILPYYHKSKQFYVTRKPTYNSVINLIRQICKVNNVVFTKDMRYNHSEYTIIYYIQKRPPPPPLVESASTHPPAADEETDV